MGLCYYNRNDRIPVHTSILVKSSDKWVVGITSSLMHTPDFIVVQILFGDVFWPITRMVEELARVPMKYREAVEERLINRKSSPENKLLLEGMNEELLKAERITNGKTS